MTTEEHLQWEARYGRPVALAAFAGGLLFLAGMVLLQSTFEDRPGIEGWADVLLSIDESPGSLIIQAVMQGIAALLLIPVFYYLFRATIHRVPQMPRWFVWFIFIGPVLYAVAQVVGAVERVDVAEIFASGDYTLEDPDPERLAEQCPAVRGEVGEDCALELLQDNANLATAVPSLIGPVLVAFMFVMVPLRARRAGLLSPFMTIVGVVTAVVFVLQISAVVANVLIAFWLGAAGSLFLGNWPGGRGPAWDSGEPDPWPSAAERRGMAPPPEEDPGAGTTAAANGGGPSTPPEPEPLPDRPSSRKRKRKQR